MGQVCQRGLLGSCIKDVGTTTLEKKKGPKNKVRPLLSDLEAVFKEFCGEDGELDFDELVSIWKKGAEEKLGKLSEEDLQLIEGSAGEAFIEMDLDQTGKVSYHEFMLHMLGDSQQRASLRQMRTRINKQFEDDPCKIANLIQMFKRWDRNGDGYVTPAELEQQLLDLENMASEAAAVEKDHLQEIREAIFDEADVDDDGRVNLHEFLAHALGRRKQPVEILLYDVSHGAADSLGKLLTGKKVQAVHSGVLVFGSEYWYGGMIMKTPPPCTKVFGNPLAAPWDTPLPMSEFDPRLPVVRCGYTFVTKQELTQFILRKLVSPYSGIEKYDLLTHNCNHFANEIVTFLTGEPLPSKIFELQKMILTPAVLAMRPLLNKVLGGFGDAGNEANKQGFLTKESAYPELSRQQSKISVAIADLHSGDVVVVKGIADDPVIAAISKEENDTYEVRYFDLESSTIITASGVKKSQVHRHDM